MATLDDIRKYIVILNGGSGCLIRPMGEDEMYILTAKHVIQDAIAAAVTMTIHRFDAADPDNPYIDVPFGDLIEQTNYFPHPTKDAAILKIGLIDGLDLFLPSEQPDEFEGNFYLCGYPELRRDEEDPYRSDEVVLLNDKPGGLREASVVSNAGWDQELGNPAAAW